MKITIDTESKRTTITKDNRITTWHHLSHLERVMLINRITEVFVKLSERIRV